MQKSNILKFSVFLVIVWLFSYALSIPASAIFPNHVRLIEHSTAIIAVSAGFCIFKKSLPQGLIISLVSVFVGLLVKDLLSQSQAISFFDRQGFNNAVTVLASILIAVSFGLIWIYITVKHRKK
jgi:hypothetical protein